MNIQRNKNALKRDKGWWLGGGGKGGRGKGERVEKGLWWGAVGRDLEVWYITLVARGQAWCFADRLVRERERERE